jgi:hypothetical protein
MASSIFQDKSKQPEDNEVAEVLGRTKKLWDDLKNYIAGRYEPVTEEWKYYSCKKTGWILTLRQKKRMILSLVPCKGHYIAGFIFSEKAVQAAHKSSLPQSIINLIKDGYKYVEGRVFRIEVKKKQDLEYIKQLVDIKIDN